MDDSLAHVSFSQKAVAKRTFGLCEVWLKCESSLGFSNSLVKLPLLQEQVGKVVVGNVIVRGNLDRTFPEPFTIMPVGTLEIAVPHQRYYYDRGNRDRQLASATPPGEQLHGAP